LRRQLLFSALSVLICVGVVPETALAQSDSRGYGGTVIRSPAMGGGVISSSGSDVPLAGNQASRLEDRINELEDLNRQLTGKVEEANFKAAQLAKQLERMQADIDLRFKELQDGKGAQMSMPAATGTAAVPPPPATTATGAPVLIPPKGAVAPGTNAASNAGPAPGPALLGQMPATKAATVPSAPAAAKDPQSAYDEAFGLAQKGDYDEAERAFQSFLKTYPNHALAGNAQYWLGDIAFSQRKDFAQSARLFGEAYKKYPKHSKAPDMLYKLGASFGQLDMKDQACRAYTLLFAEHPDMPDRVKRAANADRQRLGCK
jgi:tol-pal system protein YbgF